jgi:ABC-type multidrug transport system ATPase subunit
LKFYVDSLYIDKFRKLNELKNIKVGKKITVFSGHNGVGKSNLLSLICSSSGTNDKRLTSGNFQPEFSEYFKIDPRENVKDYRIHIKYTTDDLSLTKRVSFKDDTDTGRGIRTIPRTSVWPDSEALVKDAEQEAKEKLQIGPSARVPIPTLFVSLSRIFPMGETDIETSEIKKHTKIIQSQCNTKYKEWYNHVLPNSIANDQEQMDKVKKKSSSKSDFYMPINNSYPVSQSIGQDNLGNIITALVEFYALSLNENYDGGILCIDEVDCSLHAYAQLKLFTLLDKLSDELNLQIFVSSHSLTILQEILRLSGKSEDDYKLIYLKGTRVPLVSSFNDYEALKADLFQEMNPVQPKLKVYCEDQETRKTLELLISSAKELGIEFKLPNFEIIPVYLGANQLMKLPKSDSYFTSVVIILDGDAKSNTKIKIADFITDNSIIDGLAIANVTENIIFSPGYLPPESYLYYIINEYVSNDVDFIDFWRSVEANPDTTNMTSDKIHEQIIITNPSQLTNNNLKSHSNAIFEFADKTGILTDYYSRENNKDTLIEFIRSLETKMNKTKKVMQSRRF